MLIFTAILPVMSIVFGYHSSILSSDVYVSARVPISKSVNHVASDPYIMVLIRNVHYM